MPQSLEPTTPAVRHVPASFVRKHQEAAMYLCRKHYDEAKALTCSRCTVAVYEGDMCKWHFEEPLRCPGFEFGGPPNGVGGCCGRLKASVDAEYCPACVEVKDSSWSEMEDLWSDRGPRDNRV